ncbi:MAG: tRNA (adenosine(37)-N6)-dimethylallyltransferase MiaA [Thermoflavifilum sp.]|nr:tRNA (adenosine(37)-N6)-dimethylallyltransferase MiaA [Thermoflavifilum sp.]
MKKHSEQSYPLVIVIVGPTASGKTALALALARHFHTSIISADSRQCYQELNIGTAKPTPSELAEIKHYFINSHTIQETVNAALFEQLALQYAAEIFQDHRVAIVCGGTGLYIKAFCEGLDQIPTIPADLRKQLREQYAKKGLAWLQEEVRQKDPEFYGRADIRNPHRLLRALEVYEATGQSILHFHRKTPHQRLFRVCKVGIQPPRKQLHAQIAQRVKQMVAQGLFEEAQALWDFRQHPALQTVGYQEIFSWMEGKISRQQAIEQIIVHTRQYARRQITWFRRDSQIHWLAAPDLTTALQLIQQQCSDLPT